MVAGGRVGNDGRAAAGDLHTAALRRIHHDAVRAQLDLPDFFENLAGNHFKRIDFNLWQSLP